MRVSVYGAGVMGTGIARAARAAGLAATLVDEHTVHDPREADLVVEAIVERLDAKQTLLARVATQAPHAVLATNTSSLRVSDVGALLEPEAKGRLLGMHFFNPVKSMRLVELIRTHETRDETLQRAHAFLKRLDKVAIECNDTKGFIVNRLLVPMIVSAMRLVEEGNRVEDVDTAMKLGAGHPMGPLELADYVGLDTLQLILTSLEIDCPKVLSDLVAAGKFGRKTGSGFREWSS